MRWRPALLAFVGAALILSATPTGGRPAVASSAAVDVVIAVVNETGFNVLHSDFVTPDGSTPRPKGRTSTLFVDLPSKGSFQDRLREVRAGVLGRLPYGALHSVTGTRIVGLYNATPADGRLDDHDGYDGTTSFVHDLYHGTGVTSAAAGRVHGTDPEALLVVVHGTEAFEWLRDQAWIDFAVTSYTGLGPCTAGRGLVEFAETGRITFSAVGNGDGLSAIATPSGHPANYLVGGVDDAGRSYPPWGRPMAGRVTPGLTPNRPYETGELFNFVAASDSAMSGGMSFGGTSGAAPRTAGDAALILRHARTILGSSYTGVREGKLARLAAGGHKPARGPLADGDFTRDELIDLLHHTAVPFEAPSPGRYMVEGYGAIRPESIELAKQVLEGVAAEPQRPDEDAAHEAVTAARQVMFPEARCTDI